MSAFLRGSANYVWCTTGVLGKGATGAVFQGVSRRDGEPVAVKTFNQLSYMRSHEVQMREFEVLKKVNHGNIVKLLAIEEEQEGRGKVIVMELCTGGSLFNILDDPENAYGLNENEFLMVLEHLSAGMKHLRDNNVVHRDLKPGNIMKFIADDGQITYKLTDFGAARELEEDQEFMSLYGTEEYLHPDLYERAVLRKPVGKTFSATVDLWSIGVTLYHVATGNLPFRPYGGRKNKETMYYITTKKSSGVISGIQTMENGPIDWYTDLPTSCQLSNGLKTLVTPLLGGLLEVDTQKMWTFDRFFTEVTKLLECRIIHVFYVNKLAPLRIYIRPEHMYKEFELLITKQTDIQSQSQIVLLKEEYFLSLVSEKTLARSYPETQEDNPVILFHRENNNAVLVSSLELPKFPSYPNIVGVENDASLAKVACSVGHAYKRKIEKLSHASSIIHLAEKTLVSVITKLLDSTFKKSENSKYITKLLGKEFQMLLSWEKSMNIMLQMQPHLECRVDIREKLRNLSDHMQNKQLKFGVLNQQLSALVVAIQQLHTRCVTNQSLHSEWKGSTQVIPSISKAPQKVATYVKKLRESWQHLLRDKASRNLTYNDEQFHILEKLKMQKTGKDIIELLNAECQIPVSLIVEGLADWYKMAQAIFLQVEILAKDISVYDQNQVAFIQELDLLYETYRRDISVLLESLQGSASQPCTKDTETSDVAEPKSNHSSKLVNTFDKSLRELTTVQEQVFNILKENSELVTQFQQLTLTLFPGDIKSDSQNENSLGIINKSSEF